MRLPTVPIMLCLFVLSAVRPTFSQERQPKTVVNYRSPERHYVSVPVGKRVIQVEKQLADENPTLMRRTLQRLGMNIDKALSIFPTQHARMLEPIPFFLMYGSDSAGGGHDSGLAYFQREAPSNRQWLDETWGSSIVVYSAANYVSITDFWALKSVTHELAHAYQLEQWPEKQSEVLDAYQNAMKGGLYHGVRDDKGKTLAKAYAAENQLEYFAELSCMYFVGCNYQPQDRRTLLAYDPKGHAMIEAMWSVERAPPPTKLPRRIWQDPSGKFNVVARFVDQDDNIVQLEKDDHSELKVPRSRLSDVDQLYVDRLLRAGPRLTR